MKYPFLISILSCFIFITFQGCSNTGCTDSTADNFDPDATESSDDCIPARDKFISSYSIQEQCGVNPFTYDIAIVASPSGKQNVIINNFGNFNIPMNAEINGSLIHIIEGTYGNKIISGQGELSGNILVMSYTAADDSTTNSVSCSFTATKIQ
jgi:hypothetical protein